MKFSTDFKFGETWTTSKLEQCLKSFYERKQGFLDILEDEQTIEKIDNFVTDHHEKFDKVVVLGIGGSALGTIALRDALLSKSERDCLRVIDNIDPEFIHEQTYDLDLKRTIFIVVTKSGGTVETMALYAILKNKIEKSGLNPKDHFAFVTDPKTGLLREISKLESIPTFDVPESVGGRFSVLTSVSLLPLALVGIDIHSIVKSAKLMKQNVLDNDVNINLAFQIAVFQYENYINGKQINVLFPYSNKLKTFGEWYSQLLAESIGKIDKQKQSVGITPVTAIGATDQHSQLQLYAQGPDDKMYIFVKINKFAYDFEIYEHFLKHKVEKDKLGFIVDLKLSELLNAELDGTYKSLTELDKPTSILEIEEIDADAVGKLIITFEMATALLGELLEINAFDQPGVERSKIITKEILKLRNGN